MAHAVLHFNEQLERIGEVGVVVMIGAMLSWELLMPEALWFLAFAIPLYQAGVGWFLR